MIIVDDSTFMRQSLTRMFSSDPEINVIDTAKNGQEALEKVKLLKPDVITLDIEMPVMDGLTALQRIRSECSPPPAVLMCSSLTAEGSREALRALRLGAADVIEKDGDKFGLNSETMRDELLAKIKAIASGHRDRIALTATRLAGQSTSGAAGFSRVPPTTPPGGLPPASAGRRAIRTRQFELVVIGSSTGGPPVLETIVTALPATYRIPVIIAQHMPALFTKSLAERLDDICEVSVVHAENGMKLHRGTVYIAPGGKQTRVKMHLGSMVLEVNEEPAALLYKPCINELFSSAARVTGAKTLAVICTGMGDDGCMGARDLYARNATIIAQDAETSVVYGMPRAVAVANLIDSAMPPEDLAAAVATAGAGLSELAAESVPAARPAVTPAATSSIASPLRRAS